MLRDHDCVDELLNVTAGAPERRLDLGLVDGKQRIERVGYARHRRGEVARAQPTRDVALAPTRIHSAKDLEGRGACPIGEGIEATNLVELTRGAHREGSRSKAKA